MYGNPTSILYNIKFSVIDLSFILSNCYLVSPPSTIPLASKINTVLSLIRGASFPILFIQPFSF